MEQNGVGEAFWLGVNWLVNPWSKSGLAANQRAISEQAFHSFFLSSGSAADIM